MIVEYSLSINGYSTITGNLCAGNKELGAAAVRYDSYLGQFGIEYPMVREGDPEN